MVHRSTDFDKVKFKTEYSRLQKKYQKDIENDEQKGYDKIMSKLLRTTKSGLVYKE